MSPEAVARTLTFAGTAGFVYFFFLAKSEAGTAMAVCVLVGSGVFNYGAAKPFVVPLFAAMVGILLLLQAVQGEFFPALLGAALGVGLPYLTHLRHNRPSGSAK